MGLFSPHAHEVIRGLMMAADGLNHMSHTDNSHLQLMLDVFNFVGIPYTIRHSRRLMIGNSVLIFDDEGTFVRAEWLNSKGGIQVELPDRRTERIVFEVPAKLIDGVRRASEEELLTFTSQIKRMGYELASVGASIKSPEEEQNVKGQEEATEREPGARAASDSNGESP